MALPHSRNHTSAAGQVQGGSMWMSIQSHIVGFVVKGRRKPQNLQLSPFGIRSEWIWNPANPYVESTAPTQQHRVPLVMRESDRLITLDVRYWKNNVGSMAANLIRTNLVSGTPSVVASVVLSGGVGVWSTSSGTLSLHKYSTAHSYLIEITSGQAGDRLSGLELRYDHR